MLAGFAGYGAPCAVFLSIVDFRGGSTGAVLGQGRADLQRPDSHGRTVCRNKEFPLLLDRVIDVPVVQFVQAYQVVVQTCKLWFPTVAVHRCECAATRCLATVKVAQGLSSSPEFVDTSLCNRDGSCAWRWLR